MTSETSSERIPTRRALNRTLLARQALLDRDRVGDAGATIDHLVGMQAQLPRDPHLALWSRLHSYDPASLDALLEQREAVRTTLMRGTLHLVSAADALEIWPLLKDNLRGVVLSGARKRALAGADIDALLAEGQRLLQNQPMTRAELKRQIAALHPDVDAGALAEAVGGATPTVQIPPRGMWRRSMAPTIAPTTTWLDSELSPAPSLPELVVRYLRAYGPAAPADFQAWSGLTRTATAFADLGGALVTLREESGRLLYDVADAPWPDEGTPAPVRFLPVYDNVVLGFADRSRILGDNQMWSGALFVGLNANYGSFLVDGFVTGLWRDVEERGTVTLTVRPARDLTRSEKVDVLDEAERFLTFIAADRHGVLTLITD